MDEHSELPLNLRPDVNDHNCFGCGNLNDHGLHLELFPDPDGDGVMSRFVAPYHAEGYTGMVHGGLISTMLDEVMAWTLYRHGIWAVTAELTTRYRQPVPIGQAIIARGHLERDRGRVVDVSGTIVQESDGRLLAEGSARFVRVSPDQADSWQQRYGGIVKPKVNP